MLKLNFFWLQAEKWLKEQAQKEGWAKATKLQDRPMSQGLIGLIKENNMAAMVEVSDISICIICSETRVVYQDYFI